MAAEPARTSDGHDPRPRGVVQPLARAAHRRCSRPGCPTPAMATLTFQYDAREARLTALVADGGPETYDLCTDHAERTRPPHGWTLHDDRPVEAPGELPDADDLRSSHTVEVLAAALRGHDAGDRPGPGDAEVDDVAASRPQPAAHVQPVDEETAHDDGSDGVSEPAAGDDLAAQVDVDALDAIVEQPFDDVADRDLLASPDESDPRPDASTASSDALTELSALSEHPDPTPSSPGRTVPGARRPD